MSGMNSMKHVNRWAFKGTLSRGTDAAERLKMTQESTAIVLIVDTATQHFRGKHQTFMC